MSRSAAFFDLDRTLIRRSSALALAGSFRRHGLISRTVVAKSVFWQALFVLRGVSAERVRSVSEEGMKVLAGFSVADMQRLVGDAMEDVLRPLVYQEPLRLVQHHRERGERVYIVSATLQEIVDGVYTGRSLRAAHGEGKAVALRELAAAEDLDLDASTAYSDSYSDVPFLEAVGHPVAANPDRRLRAIAAARGWPVVEFAS